MYKQECSIDRSDDKVRQEYKRYKKKQPAPDFTEVIDFCNVEPFSEKVEAIELTVPQCTDITYCTLGLKHPKNWNVYELKTSPGFIVVTNPFLSYRAQSYWLKQTLTTYTKDPYPCNLDILMKLDKTKSMWELSHEKSPDNNSFINQLRWVHMGYHFDYNTVDYKLKKYHGFPEDLALLTKTVANVFNFPDYVSETGIINYYPEGSTMGGHTDHYEEELSQPLIAYSFGQSAIYLIGGQTRNIKPEAIWVRSGDLMLMTGESRTAFHAVPRIMTKNMKSAPSDIGTCPLAMSDLNVGKTSACEAKEQHDHIWQDETRTNSWDEFRKYLSKTRININIRQVHKYQGDSNP